MFKRVLLPAFSFLLFSAVFTLANSEAKPAVLKGVVQDKTGGRISEASIILADQATGEKRESSSDGRGDFRLEGLPEGTYTLTVRREGFQDHEQEVEMKASGLDDIVVVLEVAGTRTDIAVNSEGPANSDSNYKALRDARPGETYSVENVTLKRDLATFTFKSGRLTFLPAVLGKRVLVLFSGSGELSLSPKIPLEKAYLQFLTSETSVQEPFDRAVFCFTDGTFEEIQKAGTPRGLDPRADEILKSFRKRVRYRTDEPRTLVESLLSYDHVENLDATLLADLYNPAQAGLFDAYIWGSKFPDLRFHMRPRGVLQQLPASEEVALINIDRDDKKEGILYLAHLETEYEKGGHIDDKRSIDALHYRIETTLDGDKLKASAELTFKALLDGERILFFDLLPNLRVRAVTFNGTSTGFIQENKKEDGSFYAVLPEPTKKGSEYKIGIEYGGDKVVEDAGGGNFSVGARTSWYPSVNAFTDRATFDLTFKLPRKYTLVGVGKQVKEWNEDNLTATQWVSDVPLAVAGFNYGRFKKKTLTDKETQYEIEGYATSALPDYLKGAEDIGGMSPSRLTDKMMVEAQNSIRVFSHWFGPAPYGRIAITQQPQFNFGQSWPSLVYLPILAFFDSTQRWQLLGGIERGVTEFVQELTPHEVAHQWWGHIVGWKTFHDQWISEGFADFSAGIFLEATEPRDRYLRFWDQSRKTIVEKDRFGNRANDVGPIWLGLRLNTANSPGAYSRLVYPKGGFVLHMLRWMMWDAKTGDQAFIAMMKDFVKTHTHENASTESFKKMVEKHMTPIMDLDQNGSMDWFFNEWVYGNQLPSYKLEYQLKPQDGKFLLSGTVTQSEVTDDFRMIVPIYIDMGNNLMRLGQASVFGTAPAKFEVLLPQKPKQVLINANQDVLTAESVNKGN